MQPWVLAEEILDSIAVFAAVLSANYWWKSSRLSLAATDFSPAAAAKLNARAAVSAAIAALLQALAVMTHVFTLAA